MFGFEKENMKERKKKLKVIKILIMFDFFLL